MFTSPEHLEAFKNFINGQHPNKSFTIENEKQNRMLFLDVHIIYDDLPLLPTINLPLVEFIRILKAFYDLPIVLVLFTQLLIDTFKYAHTGLNYTLNDL